MPSQLAGCTSKWWVVRPMKRLVEVGSAVYPHRLLPQQRGWGLLRQQAGALLLDYDAVEGTGAVSPCRQYIKVAVAGSEGDEEVGRGWQCRLSSLAAAVTTGERDSLRRLAGAQLLDYDALERGRALSCLAGCMLRRRAVRLMKTLVVPFILSQSTLPCTLRWSKWQIEKNEQSTSCTCFLISSSPQKI